MSYRYLFVIPFVILAYAAYCVYLFWSAGQKSLPLIAATPAFNRDDPSLTKRILVIGDSLAVGVGAPSDETVAALLGTAMHANVTNLAKSGAHTKDLEGQLAAAQNSHYDLVVIQMGANDIIQLMSLSTAAEHMDRALIDAKKKSDHVVFLIAGNIGDAPLWPWPFRSIYRSRTLDLRARYMQLATKHDALFIDIYAAGDVFASDPKKYYAPDSLHLTAAGYSKWFDLIRAAVHERWADLL